MNVKCGADRWRYQSRQVYSNPCVIAAGRRRRGHAGRRVANAQQDSLIREPRLAQWDRTTGGRDGLRHCAGQHRPLPGTRSRLKVCEFAPWNLRLRVDEIPGQQPDRRSDETSTSTTRTGRETAHTPAPREFRARPQPVTTDSPATTWTVISTEPPRWDCSSTRL